MRRINPRRHHRKQLPEVARECAHLGESYGDQIAVTCYCRKGSTTRIYDIFTCAVHVKAVPDYRCTGDSKKAYAETASRTDGGPIDALKHCRDCILNHEGFKRKRV